MSKRWKALICLLISASISIAWGWSIQASSGGGMADFKAVYYGARCVQQGTDPYRPADFMRVYEASGGKLPSDPATNAAFRVAVPFCINLPTSLLLLLPFAILPWNLAHYAWMVLEATGLVVAGFLALDMAGDHAHRVSLFFVCLILANCEIMLASGNLAVLAVSFSVIAIWCLEKAKFVWLGLCLLSIALAVKPHDAGLVWLCLLMSRGFFRRSALKSLILVLSLAFCSVFWIWHVGPHWATELHSNLLLTSGRGDLNDPGPSSLTGNALTMILDLQSVLSFFRDDPSFYNPVTYMICGSILLLWMIVTMKARGAIKDISFGLACVVPLSMLITYHRSYDAKLLLLTIPACAALWKEGGVLKWLAFLVNGITFLLCGDITLSLLLVLEAKLHIALNGWTGTLVKVLMERPIPLALLTMAIFYLVVYVHRVGKRDSGDCTSAETEPAV